MYDNDNERFAVIDTETTWANELMSIGVVISDSKNFNVADKRYYILLPYKNHGAMYSSELYINGIVPDSEGDRMSIIRELSKFLSDWNINKIFAYNALFDRSRLPELNCFAWYDIMKIACNKLYNKKIPDSAECYSTGKLKRGYGVENIYRLLSDNIKYRETHNALYDAADELFIMKMLELEIESYDTVKLNYNNTRSNRH